MCVKQGDKHSARLTLHGKKKVSNFAIKILKVVLNHLEDPTSMMQLKAVVIYSIKKGGGDVLLRLSGSHELENSVTRGFRVVCERG